MNPIIKPIETTYRGYRFRSRLEARWAVFFDAAGIKWLYEQQGFEVNGKPYLPDFLLPAFGYFEVRGIKFDCDDELLQALADGTGHTVYIAFEEIPKPESCGQGNGYLRSFFPGFTKDEYPGDMYDGSSDFMFPYLAWGSDDMFLRCTSCGDVVIADASYGTMKGVCACSVTSRSNTSRLMPLSDALTKARSARFEHGETAHA